MGRPTGGIDRGQLERLEVGSHGDWCQTGGRHRGERGEDGDRDPRAAGEGRAGGNRLRDVERMRSEDEESPLTRPPPATHLRGDVFSCVSQTALKCV